MNCFDLVRKEIMKKRGSRIQSKKLYSRLSKMTDDPVSVRKSIIELAELGWLQCTLTSNGFPISSFIFVNEEPVSTRIGFFRFGVKEGSRLVLVANKKQAQLSRNNHDNCARMCGNNAL